MSQTETASEELDMNVLSETRPEAQHDAHGWFQGGSHSYDWLLKFKVVRDWIDTYTEKNTRKQKLYQFEKVMKAAKLQDPAELLKLSDLEAKNLVKRVAQHYLQQGKANWARQTWITMRGFYEAHDRELKFKRAEKIRTPPRRKVSIEYVPMKLDVYRMADVANSLRNKAMILDLFESGVRVGCLCRWTYGMVSDQLYPEIELPVQLRITPEQDSKLNLYGLDYYVTFLGAEGAEALRDYIESRKRDGWKPKPKDPIFIPEASASKNSKLSPGSVWEVVKASAEKAGLKSEGIWTHTLRKAFRKVLNSSPIDEDTKEALMGHKLPGSRGSYFDYHDLEEVAGKYQQADFSRHNGGNGRVKALEEKAQDYENFKLEVDKRLDRIEKLVLHATGKKH